MTGPVLPEHDVTPSAFQDTPEYVSNPFSDTPEFVANPFPDIKQWYIIVREGTVLFDRGDRISGQFTPQQMTKNKGSVIAEAGGYSRMSPIIQWVGGKLDTYTFQARLFSAHRDDQTAADKLTQIEYLMEAESTLGRPPIVSFFWGVAIPDGFPCMVDSIGGITYDEIRSDGTPRGVTLSITLKHRTRFRFEQVVTAQTERTPTHIAIHGETYEMIAEREYGDPMLGVLLRQMNPRSPMTKNAPRSVADLSPGDEVKIYPIRDMRREPVRPKCHILRMDNRLAADNRRYFFELRAREIATIPRM